MLGELITPNFQAFGEIYNYYTESSKLLGIHYDESFFENILKTVPIVLKAYPEPEVFEMFSSFALHHSDVFDSVVQRCLSKNDRKEFMRRMKINNRVFLKGNG